MLDVATLRVCFALVAVTLVVLFYLAAYRTTRSTYCGWWCVSLVLFVAGSGLYVLDGTAQQVWANPAGNAVTVLGGSAVWAAAASLHGAAPPRWQLGVVPLVVLAASVVDDPATNAWSGGELYLPALSLLLALAATELWAFRRTALDDPALRPDGPLPGLVMAMVVISAGTSVFYLGRTLAFWAVGPDGELFDVWFGSRPTTLLLIVLLATVSFSMSSLSNEQRTSDLQTRATVDGLTGLLNRTEFLRLAELRQRVGDPRGPTDACIVADLDHFKRINDTRGHAAGDDVLRAFAAAVAASVRSEDLVGRYGGEEFVVWLPGASAPRAEQLARDVNLRLAQALGAMGEVPTASYGIAVAPAGGSVARLIAAADAAMYRAKQAGRDRVVHAADLPGTASA